jgi:hypothetical protein
MVMARVEVVAMAVTKARVSAEAAEVMVMAGVDLETVEEASAPDEEEAEEVPAEKGSTTTTIPIARTAPTGEIAATTTTTTTTTTTVTGGRVPIRATTVMTTAEGARIQIMVGVTPPQSRSLLSQQRHKKPHLQLRRQRKQRAMSLLPAQRIAQAQ